MDNRTVLQVRHIKYITFKEDNIMKEQFKTFIPENDVILEYGEMSMNQIVELMRRHKNSPDAIQFIADMLEE